MAIIHALRVASPMIKSGRRRSDSGARLWNSPKSRPTIGSSHAWCRSSSSIMPLSHVLPLRPEPKIQMMFSGATPFTRAFLPSSLARSLAVFGEMSLYISNSQRQPCSSNRLLPAAWRKARPPSFRARARASSNIVPSKRPRTDACLVVRHHLHILHRFELVLPLGLAPEHLLLTAHPSGSLI